MISLAVKILFLAILTLGAALAASAQTDASSALPGRDNRRREEEAKTIKDMLAKQQALRDKKDHAEMLKRGEQALQIASQLEKSFEQNEQLSPQDKTKLESLEKLVTKIRNELGGDDVDEEDETKTVKPSSLKEAFNFLQSTTVKLVDELKKTSRFSISALAIQSSNTVIKLARFLRLRQ